MMSKRLEFVSYDGAYPNLCYGVLCVKVDDDEVTFDRYSLSSGGGIWSEEENDYCPVEGPWSVNEWPEGFPEELKAELVELINNNVPLGCCGGCI